MIQKKIFLPIYFNCDNCERKIEVLVPYNYYSTENDINQNIIDIYIKGRLDESPDLCNCDGIFNKVEEEYKKMNSSYSINH